jgi:hypothetical protein
VGALHDDVHFHEFRGQQRTVLNREALFENGFLRDGRGGRKGDEAGYDCGGGPGSDT